MEQTAPLRKKFAHLRGKPGPKGWQARAAADLQYSPGYLSKVIRGIVKSPAAAAALKEWKKTNKVA